MKTGKLAIALTLAAAAFVIVIIFTPTSKHSLGDKLHDGLIAIAGNNGNILEVATLTLDQELEEKDTLELRFGRIPFDLGTSQANLRLPVTYRFHILLSDPWSMTETAETVTIVAPPIRPPLPPAPDLSAARWQASNGWARFNKQEVSKKLQQSITPKLVMRAHRYAAGDLVHNAARTTVQNFLHQKFNFLIPDTGGKRIIVRFSDEAHATEKPMH